MGGQGVVIGQRSGTGVRSRNPIRIWSKIAGPMNVLSHFGGRSTNVVSGAVLFPVPLHKKVINSGGQPYFLQPYVPT